MQAYTFRQDESQIKQRFQLIRNLGSGAYGIVWKVKEKVTQKIFALKKVFDAYRNSTDAQRTFRQIQILKQTDHENIIKMNQVMPSKNGKDVYILFEYMQADLHSVLHEGILKNVHIAYIFYQIARAIKYLHSGLAIHRDLKPANVLINSKCHIKICDFGLVKLLPRTIGFQEQNLMTQAVATRWYRAPEILFGSRRYSQLADIWSFGCIIYEVFMKKPMFAGSDTINQIEKILSFTGQPSQSDLNSIQAQNMISILKQIKFKKQSWEKQLQNINQDMRDLILGCLKFNPNKRLTINQILSHKALKNFRKIDNEKIRDTYFQTSVNDFKRYKVEDYKKLIEKFCENTNKQVRNKCLIENISSFSTPQIQGVQQKKEKKQDIQIIPKMKQKNNFSLTKVSSQQNLKVSVTLNNQINFNNKLQNKQKSNLKLENQILIKNKSSEKLNVKIQENQKKKHFNQSEYQVDHKLALNNQEKAKYRKTQSNNPELNRFYKNTDPMKNIKIKENQEKKCPILFKSANIQGFVQKKSCNIQEMKHSITLTKNYIWNLPKSHSNAQNNRFKEKASNLTQNNIKSKETINSNNSSGQPIDIENNQ